MQINNSTKYHVYDSMGRYLGLLDINQIDWDLDITVSEVKF